MSSVKVRTLEKLVNVWEAALATLEALAEQVKCGNVNGQLGEVQTLLEALPLSSGDFSRVTNNLKNAERYLQSNEFGAAAYELRMLTGGRANLPAGRRHGHSEAEEDACGRLNPTEAQSTIIPAGRTPLCQVTRSPNCCSSSRLAIQWPIARSGSGMLRA